MIDFASRLNAVRIQDVTLVVLCALSVYLFRVREMYIVQPQWRKDFVLQHYTNHKFPSLEERLPLPIITDLESDGVNEIVLVTNDLKLEVLALPQGGPENVLPHVIIKNSTTPPVWNHEDGRKSQPVAMDTGYLVPYNSPHTARKQVIVLVLDSWKVLCYSHQLVLLWEQSLMDVGQVHEHHFVKSMGVLISPSVISRSDTGTVVIGGSFAHKTHQRRYHPQQSNGPDPQRHHAQRLGQSHIDDDAAFTHFSTFALSGDNGTVRWHHLLGDFQPDLTQLRSKEKPHHWKLALKKGRLHDGEQLWSKYASSLKEQLPHKWTSLADTKLGLANIRSNSLSDAENPTESSAVVTDLFGLQGEHLMGYAYGGLQPHSHHEHIKNPNSVVIHNHNGIELLALQSGRPFTRFPVPEEKASYADVDNDGAIDRVKMAFASDALEECYGEAMAVGTIPRDVFREPICSAPNWWSSFSLSAAFFPDPVVSEETHVTLPPTLVQSIAHKSGPFHHLMGRTLPSRRAGYDSIFLTSTGRLTSYGPQGDFNWQVHVPAKWATVAQLVQEGSLETSETVQTFNKAFKPSMTAFAPQIYGKKTALLIVGWEQLAVVDLRDGHLMAEHSLPCQPNAKPVLGDFNGNGWNDFIIACPLGYIGFSVQSQHNYGYMVVVSTAVVLAVLLLAWCCRPENDSNMDFD